MTKPNLEVRLFGRFSARLRGEPLLVHAPRKVQELVAYLILNASRAHRREELARLLWAESSDHSRKYLRQALWQLQKELHAGGEAVAALVEQDPEWVRLRATPGLWVDTVAFESAHRAAHGLRGSSIQATGAQALASGVQLYRADLLEGWYRPWCLSERERFREMYHAILGKLTEYHESRREYDAATAYASLAIRSDRANERTHRTLMRLLYLSGDRTGALRQFERCRVALSEELGVEPARETVALYERIRDDRKSVDLREGDATGDEGSDAL